MGYMKIENLYRPRAQRVLLFKSLYCMEKVHGTSCNITWKDNKLSFYSGGVNHEEFINLFHHDALKEAFEEMGHDYVRIHGEGYGGKCQRMSETYGPDLKFIAFDVFVHETWVNVVNAEKIAHQLDLEFVPYVEGPSTLEFLDEQRDATSEIAKRRGIEGFRKREGIVVRPVHEFVSSDGLRVVAKHKRADFQERRNQPKVSPDKLKVLTEANEIAFEWVTENRLDHVLDHLGNPDDMSQTSSVIKEMINDIYIEADGEIWKNNMTKKAISTATAKMYKRRVMNKIEE